MAPKKPILTFAPASRNGMNWMTHLLLACLTALLCIVSSPVFAHLSQGILIAQGLPVASQLGQQGREHYEAGQFAAAVKVWQQAAQAYQSQGSRLNQAMVLNNLALANQELGQWSQATEAIATSLELLQTQPDTPDRRRILAQALNTKGSLQMAQGQAEQSLTTLQQAAELYKQVGDEVGIIRNLLNQAQILRVLGLYRRALFTLTQVNKTLEGQPDSPLKATGLRHLGNALRLVGELKKSREALEQSLLIAEKLPSPPDIAAALLSLGNTARVQQEPETALQYYQRAAAITSVPTTRIQAQVNQLSLMVEGGVEGNVWSLVQPLLTQIQTQLTDLPISRLAVYARINFAQSLLKMGNSGPPLGIRGKSPEGNSGPPLGIRGKWGERGRRSRREEKQGRGEAGESPIAALHDGEQYLIEKYAIALTPGLELLEAQPLVRGQLKVLKAGLSEARQGFPALPAVAVELNQLQSLVAGEVLLNQEFTKTSIQNAIDAVPFPVVHLATHGQFSSKAEETFILTWDDRINVNELNNLLQRTDLRRSTPIELLVLSACETAKGDNRAALGIAGVAVRAGARSTLATLWIVDDEATAAFMVRFYQELANATVTKAEALRRAQQSILQNPKYSQPYYWAPYVLVGNWL